MTAVVRMKMFIKGHKILVSLCAAGILILALLGAYLSEALFENDPVERLLYAMTRPEAAKERPPKEFIVDDIRITAVDRDMSMFPSIFFDDYYDDGTFKQIYYGYLKDGVWHDYPMENYALKELGGIGIYGAVDGRHCVQIGQYILLAFPNSATDGVHSFTEVKDTLNSPVREMHEYVTPFKIRPPLYYEMTDPDLYSNKPRYYRVIDNHLDNSYGVVQRRFDMWYYVVLKRNDISEDYQVVVRSYFEIPNRPLDEETKFYIFTDENGKERYYTGVERTYTYADIMVALSMK